jgi:preprotein translocase subunit YajC
MPIVMPLVAIGVFVLMVVHVIRKDKRENGKLVNRLKKGK